MNSKPARDLLQEKLLLVFEYNRNSPLFVRAAGLEIDRNNFQKAVEIISEGLKNFTAYPTAYILLGKAQMLAGNYDQAEEAFRKGCSLINSRDSLNYFISELENLRRKNFHFTESRRVAFFPEDFKKLLFKDELNDLLQEEKEEADLQSEETAVNEEEAPQDLGLQENPTEENIQPAEDDIDEKLEALAKEISFAKISVKPVSGDETHAEPEQPAIKEEKKPEEDSDMAIVSETLAKIYLSQGRFREAAAVYKKLMIKTPEKADYYKQKVDEIESQLSDMDW